MDSRSLAIATSNEGKVRYLSYWFRCYNLHDVIWLKDETNLSGASEGSSGVENAKRKAIQGSLGVKVPVIATDEELHLLFLGTDQQPGALIRRVIGEATTDDQVIAFYERLFAKVGPDERRGTVTTYFGLAREGILLGWESIAQECLFKLPPAGHWTAGRPLSALHFVPELAKYYCELNDEEICRVDELHIRRLQKFVCAHFNF